VEQTDWPRIVELYGLLYALRPSPMVALNRAIAVGEASGPEAGLAALGELAHEARLSISPFLAAALGRFQLRAGRREEAERSFGMAAEKARNPAEEKLFRSLQNQSRK
jgi:RNA polymerase sigma-70 factor (ECF subfamily)